MILDFDFDLVGFCSVEVGGVTEKLDDDGGSGGMVDRGREIEIRERNEKYFYIILM